MKVGDLVKVIDDGQIYSTYYEMAILFSIENLCSWSPADKKQVFEIKGIKEHLLDNSLIAHIEEVKLGAEFMIGVEGLEVIEESFELEIGDFLV